MRAVVLSIFACLIVAACSSDPTAPSEAPLGAAYQLSAINGDTVPCCSQVRFDGRTEQWVGGELDFTGPDTYTWTVKLEIDAYVVSGSISLAMSLDDSVVSAGHYSRQGRSLLLSDSATSRRFTATVVADTITIIDHGTTYRFRIAPPVSLSESVWAEASCTSVDGDSLGCPITNQLGVVMTNIGGGLQFDYNVPADHYALEVLYERRQPGGATDTVQVTTAGTYLWDGTTLKMKDDATGATMTGRLGGGPFDLLIQSGASVLEFFRISAPHP